VQARSLNPDLVAKSSIALYFVIFLLSFALLATPGGYIPAYALMCAVGVVPVIARFVPPTLMRNFCMCQEVNVRVLGSSASRDVAGHVGTEQRHRDGAK
jgi:hypothetical protein